MPKIIDNLRSTLIAGTRDVIAEQGYAGMSIRAVAKRCGIAPGTVYNYFSSKEALIAACMLDDWRGTAERMHAAAESAESIRDVLSIVYHEIEEFCNRNEKIIRDPAASESFQGYARKYHMLLVKEVSGIIEPATRAHAVKYSDDLTEFVAENLIVRAARADSFDRYYAIIELLFK